MKLRIKNTKTTVIIIGWLQLIGGIYGLGLVSNLMINIESLNGAILFILLFGLSLYILSIKAGYNLLVDENKKIGIILSIINYAFQIIQWKILGYGLWYSTGIETTVGIKVLSLHFDLKLTSPSFNMSISTSKEEFYFLVNLFAIFLIIVLIDVFKEKNKEKKLNSDIEMTENSIE